MEGGGERKPREEEEESGQWVCARRGGLKVGAHMKPNIV